MYDLLPVSRARKQGSNAKMHDLWQCLGLERSEVGPNAKMHKLLLVSWARSGVRTLRCTSCYRCLGLEAGSEC